jgi:hypothetical protein
MVRPETKVRSKDRANVDGRAKPDVDQSKEPKRLGWMERTRKGESLKERHGRGNAHGKHPQLQGSRNDRFRTEVDGEMEQLVQNEMVWNDA